jgi:hypothetical protein
MSPPKSNIPKSARHRRAVLLSLLLPAALLSQVGGGSIQGTVTDPTGAVIPAAKVTAENIETANTFQTLSNKAGFFVFTSTQPGKYRVTADAPGMQKWTAELQLQTGQDAVIAPVLSVGATSTQITVAGDVTSVVTTTSPTLSSVVERARIEELPLNGRFFQNLLAVTTPGLEAGQGGNGSPQAFGLRDGLVQFVQDGVQISDQNTTTITNRPPGMDTIQEYRVEMSVASAKYSSAVTTVLSTRSGTNQLHGGLFYTGRNNGFGVARQRQDFYTKPPQLIRNEYGVSLGGPVRIPRLYNGKDRTFFFAAWEGYSLRSGSTMSSNLPTQAMQQGDYSQLTDGQNRPIALYDPLSTAGAAQNYSRVPFTGDVIPVNRRSPFAAYFYSVLPQPNQPNINPSVAANWFGPDPSKQNDWTYTIRIDHRLGDKDQIFGRYTMGNRNLQNRRAFQNPAPLTIDKLWNSQSDTERMQTVSLTWNHIFGPSFAVETVVTGARFDWQFDLSEPTAQQNLAPKLGVPNPFNIPGAPNLTNLGFALQGTGVIPRFDDTKPITGEQNYTLVRGKHQLEFGWRVQHTMLDVLPDRPGEAAISFASQATGLYDPATGSAFNSLPRTGDNGANFFLGVAASYAQTLPAPQYYLRSNELSGYFQDTWKVTRDLTLNLGVRYDFLQPLLDTGGVNAVFDLANHAIVRQVTVADLIRQGATTQSIVDSYTAIGVKFETTKQAGLPGGLVNVGQRNFGPRLGFAYNWKLGKRSLVVRGGFGAYRFNLGTRLFNVQRGNPPLQGTISYNINAAAQSPDGLPNYGLRSVPTVFAGTSSAANILDPKSANAIPRGVTINAFAPSLPAPLAREWNLTLETEIIRNTLLRVAYVGTAARNLDESVQINGQPSNFTYYTTTGKPLPTGAFAPVALRDYDQTTYGAIQVYSNTGFSNYSGLQVEVQRRFGQGLGFQWFYVMSNAMWAGSGAQILGSSAQLPDPVTFLPGAVPSKFDAYNRFYNYARDPNIPKHRVSWNMLYDLPVGRGKRWLSNSGRLLNTIAGGWQLAAYSTMGSRYVTLPTTNWGSFSSVEIYGTKYPVQDCRSGTCIRGYLYYNGYIPANQINTKNGVMGVPANYHPAHQPIYPTPANPNPSDPNYALYGTNLVSIPLQNGTSVRIPYDNGLNPWRNQYVPGPWAWTVNSSLFKVIPLNERFKLRLNMDFFNVFNHPGTPMPNPETGIITLQNSSNAPRQLQWTLRLNW